MPYPNMSRLRKTVSTVAPSAPSSEPTDYVPQHPMAAFRHVASPEPQADHLEQYAEVRPFEDAEWSWKRFKDGAKNAVRSAGDGAKNTARSAGRFVSDKKYKYDVGKASKLVGTIDSDTKHMPNKVSAYKRKLDSDIAAIAANLKQQRQDEPAKIEAYRKKLVRAVDAKKAKIKQIRERQTDKDAFDDAVEAKLDAREKKIYMGVLN